MNNRFRASLRGLALLSGLGLFGQTHAAITIYTDEPTFKTDLGAATTHTFDSGFPDVSTFPPFGTPLDLQLPGLDFDNAVVRVGNFGGTFQSASNVVMNEDIINPIVITFLTPVKGVGLFNTSLVDRERLSVFDATDTLLASIDLAEATVNFGGFISDSANISRVRVTPIQPTNGSIYIDTLTVAAPVPLPGTTGLFGVALGALAYLRRRGV